MEDGRPYEASRELARYLSTTDFVAPETVLLTAEALLETRSWSAARRLLVGQPWLETEYGADGLRLLAQALVGLDSVDAALETFEHYFAIRLTADDASTDASLMARVAYARALSRAERDAEAAYQFETAADENAGIRHWLLLSALQRASLDGDPETAGRLAERLAAGDLPIPEDSVWVPFVLSAFRAGDEALGLRRATRLSRQAFQMLTGEFIGPALEAKGDTEAATRAYEDALSSRRSGPEVGDALLRLEPGVATASRVAASDLRGGRAARAAELLATAVAAAPDRDWLALQVDLAQALFAARDYSGVLRAVAEVIERPELSDGARASMLLLRARSLYRTGRRSSSKPVFERTALASSNNSSAFAAYLVADMAQTDGDLELASQWYAETVMRYPRSMHAGTSLMRLGLIAFEIGDYEAAVEHFDTYRVRFPRENWFQAASYWSARSKEAADDTAAARVLYLETVGYSPVTFYGIQAAQRSGIQAWDELTLRTQPAAPELEPYYRDVLEHMDLLRRIGWSGRAVRDLRAARGARVTTAAQLLALSQALNEEGWTSEGITLGWEVHRRKGGQWSVALMQAIYPLPYRSAVEHSAAREGLDPGFVAGLMRQESMFDHDIVSSAGAVGLMQLMPRTATGLAGESGVTEFHTGQLEVPEINLLLGSRYLASLLRRFSGSRTGALISYNAGPHRFVSWRDFPEYSVDEELFIERIPFNETRRYVKNVEANAYIYRRLYDL
jgi:soluble lytic murein transglycosylase